MNIPEHFILKYLSVFFYFILTLFATIWGVLEFFHEGWFFPYYQFVYYFIPGIIFLLFTFLALFKPIFAVLINILFVSFYTIFRIKMLTRLHYPILPSLWIVSVFMISPAIFLIIFLYIDKKYVKNNNIQKNLLARESALDVSSIKEDKISKDENVNSINTIKIIDKMKIYNSLKKMDKKIKLIFITIYFLIILFISIPSLINNLSRIELNDFNEKKIIVRDKEIILAPAGPGYLYTNKFPVIYQGKKYSGLSWNEIALFGKEPIGFEGKRFYYATQDDFNKYNMFRYIDYSGKLLTNKINDFWRLPTIDEYVKMMLKRGKNCSGKFQILFKKPYYKVSYSVKPDKDSPLWACNYEVIYYWSATSFNKKFAFDIGYNGKVKLVYKTTKQDYRGFRAIRTK